MMQHFAQFADLTSTQQAQQQELQLRERLREHLREHLSPSISSLSTSRHPQHLLLLSMHP